MCGMLGPHCGGVRNRGTFKKEMQLVGNMPSEEIVGFQSHCGFLVVM
jgi:hypothetical protein